MENFLTVEEASEKFEAEGGYAEEASDEFKQKREELVSRNIKKIDIVICTAMDTTQESSYDNQRII